MLRDWVALVVSVAFVGYCFWYVFFRKAPAPAVVKPGPEAWAWHRIAEAVERAAEELPVGKAEHALLLALHDKMTPGDGIDEAGFLSADRALQYALSTVISDRVASACLLEARARMTTLRLLLAEKRGWFGGVIAAEEEGPSPAVKAMREISDVVELAARAAPEEAVPALRLLWKALPRETPTPEGVVRVESDLSAALDQLGDTRAAEHLRAALRMVAELKTLIPGAVAASWEAPAR